MVGDKIIIDLPNFGNASGANSHLVVPTTGLGTDITVSGSGEQVTIEVRGGGHSYCC